MYNLHAWKPVLSAHYHMEYGRVCFVCGCILRADTKTSSGFRPSGTHGNAIPGPPHIDCKRSYGPYRPAILGGTHVRVRSIVGCGDHGHHITTVT